MEWANPEKIQKGGGGGWRIWNFQRYHRNIMWNFQGLIKNEVEFVLVNTILWNIQGLSFVLSEISRGKVKKMKKIEVFKKVYPQPPCLDFSPIQLTSIIVLRCSTSSSSKTNLLKPLTNVILDPLGQKSTSITDHGPSKSFFDWNNISQICIWWLWLPDLRWCVCQLQLVPK